MTQPQKKTTPPLHTTALAVTLGLLAPLVGQAQENPAQSNGQKIGHFFAGVKDKLGLRIERPELGSNGSTLYAPLTGGQTFPTLFRNEDHDQAIQGHLQWPRAALTFVEYGRNLPCWTVKATIWTSPTVSREETFKTCMDAKLNKTNDLGETSTFGRSIGFVGLFNAQPRFGAVPTTGDSRTRGPNPPRLLFQVDVDKAMRDKLRDIVINAAWVSGFYGQGNDLSHASIFYDYRMWIAGFEPSGNRG
ncbi:hypothetical protein [Xanthomonas translucens]|uniref:hypothetical protein n=1 Tax=Xanthomonas campestris pv. translucens TaxID=343 RepID=UPI001F612C6F|nr:hypothetical protein [Xanthomonas translucens]UNU10228.1 hypothetical protein KBV71_13210 [Xanthomonas translucens pv. translucens]